MANIRTFKNLQDEVLAWIDEVGDAGISLTKVKQGIRAAHEKRLVEERHAFMLSRTKQFTTVVGKQTYSLDADCLRLLYLKNVTTASLLIEQQAQNILDTGLLTPDPSSSYGVPDSFTAWGRSEVKDQPTSASVIAVTSSNSADNAVASVTVRGDTTTGVQSETVLCNASGLIAFTEILKVTKSSGWVGTMTLTSNATVVTNLTLGATEYGKSYPNIYLPLIPTAAQVLEYRFYRQPSPLVADNDRPDYPAPFEELLVWETLLDMATYNSYTESMINYWTVKRDGLLLAMQHSSQAQTINQAAVYTTYVPR